MNDWRYNVPDDYGSTARYNQLQNYPNNIPDGIDMLAGISPFPVQFDEKMKNNYQKQWDIDKQLPYNYRWNQATNKYDMQGVENLSKELAYNSSLNDMLQQVFEDEGMAEQYPEWQQSLNPPAPTPQEGERHPKGFGRPMAMTYDEYERQYMPYQYAERVRNNMHNNYDNYTQGINLDEYLDQLE